MYVVCMSLVRQLGAYVCLYFVRYLCRSHVRYVVLALGSCVFR